MKVSEIDVDTLLAHLRIEPRWATEAERGLASACLPAARAYVRDHCAVTDEYMDGHEDLTVAVLVLASDMYDQRSVYAEQANPNLTVHAILSHHDFNLVEGEETEGAGK